MYWNNQGAVIEAGELTFNNNIRCIEISEHEREKHDFYSFNNNIRCIEIFKLPAMQDLRERFNNNIRCIEINYLQYRYMYLYRLITT